MLIKIWRCFFLRALLAEILPSNPRNLCMFSLHKKHPKSLKVQGHKKSVLESWSLKYDVSKHVWTNAHADCIRVSKNWNHTWSHSPYAIPNFGDCRDDVIFYGLLYLHLLCSRVGCDIWNHIWIMSVTNIRTWSTIKAFKVYLSIPSPIFPFINMC